MQFWNDDDDGCDDVTWEWVWTSRDHLLTTQLRQRMNYLVDNLNYQIRRSVFRLSRFGVFYVDGFQNAYDGHRFCEPNTNLKNPITEDTWFWASNRYVVCFSPGVREGSESLDGLWISFGVRRRIKVAREYPIDPLWQKARVATTGTQMMSPLVQVTCTRSRNFAILLLR